ncbi:MAG: O-methyltransferase [Muribaculaceae bacterium]|nr:O-methyltransferase [Muribaculaceae bacterium]
MFMIEQLDDYILDHISPEPDHLKVLNRHVNTRLLYSRMCSGHLQGRLLKMLTAMINPRRVLELGTYAGYSALCIAEGLRRPEARIDTIEVEDELEDFIREHFSTTPLGQRIDLHIGDALEIIPRINRGDWDMVFIDANKRTYVDYIETLLPLLPVDAFILADNTLWDGKIIDTAVNHDAQTLGIAAFNDLVARHPQLETVILPLRDGLTLLRKTRL